MRESPQLWLWQSVGPKKVYATRLARMDTQHDVVSLMLIVSCDLRTQQVTAEWACGPPTPREDRKLLEAIVEHEPGIVRRAVLLATRRHDPCVVHRRTSVDQQELYEIAELLAQLVTMDHENRTLFTEALHRFMTLSSRCPTDVVGQINGLNDSVLEPVMVVSLPPQPSGWWLITWLRRWLRL